MTEASAAEQADFALSAASQLLKQQSARAEELLGAAWIVAGANGGYFHKQSLDLAEQAARLDPENPVCRRHRAWLALEAHQGIDVVDAQDLLQAAALRDRDNALYDWLLAAHLLRLECHGTCRCCVRWTDRAARLPTPFKRKTGAFWD